MKFVFAKTIILLFLIISSNSFERKRRFAYSKSNKASSKNLNTAKSDDKFKGFLRGFLVGFLAKLVENEVKDEKEKQRIENIMNQLIVSIIDDCTLEAFKEYKEVIKAYKKEHNADKTLLYKAYGNKKEEVKKILTICQENINIEELNDNKFSTLNVAKGKVLGFLSESEFKKEYTDFNTAKEKNTGDVAEATKAAKALFADLAKKLTLYKDNDDNYNEFVKKMDKALSGAWISDDNVCEALTDFLDIPFVTTIQAFMMGSVKAVVCGGTLIVKEFASQIFEHLIEDLAKAFGLSALKGVLVAIFPPALIGFIGEFIISNFKELFKITTFFFSDDKENQEVEMYENLGKIAGKQVVSLIKKKKKFKRISKS